MDEASGLLSHGISQQTARLARLLDYRLAQWITPEDIRKSDKACTDISAEINREQDRIASQRKPK